MPERKIIGPKFKVGNTMLIHWLDEKLSSDEHRK